MHFHVCLIKSAREFRNIVSKNAQQFFHFNGPISDQNTYEHLIRSELILDSTIHETRSFAVDEGLLF